MKHTRFLPLLLAVVLVASLFTACGGSAPSENAAYDMVQEGFSEAPAEKAESLTTSDSNLNSPAATGRKLIKTVHLDAETEHYDDLIPALESKIAALGGYIESRQSRGQRSRHCSMTVRIPAEHLDSFLTHVTENANVTSSSETTEDITLQYVDTEAKIAALETEQARLLELLANAQNLSEILEIEARLSDVTYELERYSSQMRSYDNLVSFSTVHLDIHEIQVLTPTEEPTIWQRISTGFGETLSDLSTLLTDLFVWVIVNSPYLLIFGVIGFFVIRGLRKNRRRTDKFRQQPPNPPAE